MSAQALRLGPFVGGLNTVADPVSIGDDELIQCLNFELDLDGSLTNRPAIQVIEEGPVDSRILIFGSVAFSGVTYLFAAYGGGTYVSSNLGSSWTELAPGGNSRECTSMVAYQNTVWLPATPTSANGGLSWTPGGGAVAVAAMPRGSACIVHKNRMYIVPGMTATTNESRCRYSQGGDFTDWPDTNFFDVVQGDGTTLNNIKVHQNNLLLFKNNSTHVLAFDLQPADAILTQVNAVVGSRGSFGVQQHENSVFVLHRDKVYEVVNFTFELISLKIQLEFNDSMPPNTATRHEEQHLSLLGDRLVVRYFNRTYVYGIRTRTWSEWRKTDPGTDVEYHVFGPLIKAETVAGVDIEEYYTAYSFTMNDSSGYKLIRMLDGTTVDAVEGYGDESIDCIATTKDYDMADPVRFKRLAWWGADLISGNEIIASTEPITLQFSPTWDSLGETTWAELGTWGRPLTFTPRTMTTVEADGVVDTNKMVKFLKSMRFRKVNFSVTLVTNCASDNPAKIFSYIAFTKTKQRVVAQTS